MRAACCSTNPMRQQPVATPSPRAGSRLARDVVPGDFFAEVPAGGDLYVLKAILHDWDDEHSVRILRNCHRAAPADSTLLIIERLVGETDPSVHLVDLLMLTMLGGRERSRAEFETLLASGGFRLERVTPTPRFALIEARPVR